MALTKSFIIGMKQIITVLLVLGGMVCFTISSCTKSSTIGSELVEQDQAKVFITDTLSIVAKTVNLDSVKTYGPADSEQFESYLVGKYDDPVFGKVEADLYAQVNLDVTTTPSFIGRDDVVVDSVILSLLYDTTKVYGNELAIPQTFEVYTMTEPLDRGDTYYSNQTFSFDSNPIGNKTFVPKVRDSLIIVDYALSRPDTVRTVPHLRIPLSKFFGAFLKDLELSDYANSTSFKEKLPGIHIKAIAETESMLGFHLFRETSTITSRITMYYKEGEVQKEYRYPFLFASPKMNHYINDPSGKNVVNFFDNEEKGDSLIFIQGMGGMNAEVAIPYADQLGDVIINNAILEYFIATEEDSPYEPVDRIFLGIEFDDGSFSTVRDLILANSLAQLNLFGGFPVMDEQLSIKKYRMNITNHFQDMVEGENDRALITFPQLNREKADRVVLYGPGHSAYPMKLSVTYTKL